MIHQGYRYERIRSEILRVNKAGRKKRIGDNITFVLIFHPTLNAAFDKPKSAQRHIEKLEDQKKVLSKPPKVAFRNQKNSER